VPATGALNDTLTSPVPVFCVTVVDTLPQLELNTLLPPPKRKGGAEGAPGEIVSVIVKLWLPAGTVTDTQ